MRILPFSGKKEKAGLKELISRLEHDPQIREAVLQERPDDVEKRVKEVVRSVIKTQLGSSDVDEQEEQERTMHPQEPHEEIKGYLKKALDITLEKGVGAGLKVLEKAPPSQQPYLLDAFHAKLVAELMLHLVPDKQET